MKKTIKRIVGCVVFLSLVLYLVSGATEILLPKPENRYYILEDYLRDHPEDTQHDVQIFGSCHSYTSFNPVYMEERTGVSGFVYGNAGEIIPTTYVRMVEQFKKHTPKVAVVEIWGINPYETYSSQEGVFGSYLTNNLQSAETSWAKQEVIWDFRDKEFEDISLLNMNFPIVTYKGRLLENSLTKLDFEYDLAETENEILLSTYHEMTSRLKNNGYSANSPYPISDYPEKQNTIQPGEIVEIESDIVKYIYKIIDLCKDKGVELIFYRSPYISTVNELKKLNHFRQICQENDVLFLDLEAEIIYDYKCDFLDYEHLSEIGANKSTEFLLPYIMEAMGKTWEKREICRNNLIVNSDFSSEEGWKSGFNALSMTEQGLYTEVTSAESGWLLYQEVSGISVYQGQTITAVFSVVDYSGKQVAPIISFRDADGKEMITKTSEITSGKCTVTVGVPKGTDTIFVGLYAWEGNQSGDFVSVDRIELYQGAFTADNLPTVIN